MMGNNIKKGVYTGITESFCYTAQMNTMSISYTSIKIKIKTDRTIKWSEVLSYRRCAQKAWEIPSS